VGLGQPGLAAAAARQALAAEPQNEWAHRLLAVAYLRMEHRSGAITAAREAVRLAPKSAHALHLLALSQLLLKHRAAADKTARMAVAANPDEAVAHLTMARVALAHQNYALAERAYREGLRLDPNDVDLLLRLGWVLHRLGRRDEAAEAYLAAGRTDPADSRARHRLARIGLPVARVGATFVAGVLFIGVPNVMQLRPGWAAVVVGGVLLVAGSAATALRVRGTHRMPEAVRQGLAPDHRNAALRWLQIAAVAALAFAIWAVALPAAKGGGFGEAAGFAAFAVTAAYVAHRFWTGPRRSAADTARALGARLNPWPGR
jgi:Tfp pilus assembly protein PilF